MRGLHEHHCDGQQLPQSARVYGSVCMLLSTLSMHSRTSSLCRQCHQKITEHSSGSGIPEAEAQLPVVTGLSVYVTCTVCS